MNRILALFRRAPTPTPASTSTNWEALARAGQNAKTPADRAAWKRTAQAALDKEADGPQPRYFALRILDFDAGHDVRIYEASSPDVLIEWKVEPRGGRDCTDEILAATGLSKEDVLKDHGAALRSRLSSQGHTMFRLAEVTEPRPFG